MKNKKFIAPKEELLSTNVIFKLEDPNYDEYKENSLLDVSTEHIRIFDESTMITTFENSMDKDFVIAFEDKKTKGQLNLSSYSFLGSFQFYTDYASQIRVSLFNYITDDFELGEMDIDETESVMIEIYSKENEALLFW